MDRICFDIVTAITALISLDTLRRLYIDRHRFAKEDLNDYDLALVWRIVIFLIYPLLNLMALCVSVITCQNLGGYVKTLNYGLLWYQVVPDELSSRAYLIPTLFAGEIAQTLFVLIMLLALFFRPHPFLAMLLTYSCTFVLAINLIVDPALSILGFGSAHWQTAIAQGNKQELIVLAIMHFVPGLVFIFLAHNENVQKIFANWLRPVAMEKLKKAIEATENTSENPNKNNLVSSCNLIMLYEAAGLPHQASKKLAQTKRQYPQTLLASFSEAYLTYRRRDYKKALKFFLNLSDFSANLSNELRGMFLAAAACSAHAHRDLVEALNLADRALEFDGNCAVARMIKVDILLKQGNQDQAAAELQNAMHSGLDQNMEQSIPLDWQKAIRLIPDVDTCNEASSEQSKPVNQGPFTV